MRDGDSFLIAVDAHDRETGIVKKTTAHRKGVLHRAFSVVALDEAGRAS